MRYANKPTVSDLNIFPQEITYREKYSAIILAGGKATRLGGTDKPAIYIGKYRLLERALYAVASAQTTVVVGKYRPELDPSILQVRESPQYSGPAAALYAGLHALSAKKIDDKIIITLAADLPEINASIISQLLYALSLHPDWSAVFACDSTHRIQYAVAAWRYNVLAKNLGLIHSSTPYLEHTEISVPQQLINLPWKALLPTQYGTIALPQIEDCDTPADIIHAQTKYLSTYAISALEIEAAWQVLSHLKPCIPREINLDHISYPTHRMTYHGMSLAEDLIAATPNPAYRISAMDGYAVRGNSPWKSQSKMITAGAIENFSLKLGEAIPIATGAKVPFSADRVLRHEFCTLDGEFILSEVFNRDDSRKIGEDWAAGTVLATAGAPLDLPLLSLCATLGQVQLQVRGPIYARAFITGAEITIPDQSDNSTLISTYTHDSLGPILPDLLLQNGIILENIQYISDELNQLIFILPQKTSDSLSPLTEQPRITFVIGSTGGSPSDLLTLALARDHAHYIIPGIACSPGGSAMVAQLPDGQIIIGLPGNPFAAFVAYHLLIPHIVHALTGQTPPYYGTVPVIYRGQAHKTRYKILPVFINSEGEHICADTIRTSHLYDAIGAVALALIPPLDSIQLFGQNNHFMAKIIPLNRF